MYICCCKNFRQGTKKIISIFYTKAFRICSFAHKKGYVAKNKFAS